MAEGTQQDRKPPKVVFSPSQPGDEAALARLWCITFSEKYRFLFGGLAEAVLETWLTRDPRVHRGSIVARVEGAPAGFVQLDTDHPSFTEDAAALWSALFRHFGPIGAFTRLLRLWVSERAPAVPPNALHLRMLAVDPNYRGRGIATMLLRYAEAHAMRQQKEQLILRVSSTNEAALRLYERHGFARRPLQNSRLLRWATGQGGHYQMVKRLK